MPRVLATVYSSTFASSYCAIEKGRKKKGKRKKKKGKEEKLPNIHEELNGFCKISKKKAYFSLLNG